MIVRRGRICMDEANQDGRLRWIGPFRLGDYLDGCIDPTHERPPEAPGVYIVSRDSWSGRPTASCQALYVGANPKRPTYFRQRVGFLVMAMLGFSGDAGWRHDGGQRCWEWCCEKRIRPTDLYLGWVVGMECVGCVEARLHMLLAPELSRKAPTRCSKHPVSTEPLA
jgi:hypothetical protein